MKLNATLCDFCGEAIEPKDINNIGSIRGAALKAALKEAGLSDSPDACPECSKEIGATLGR